MVRRPGSSAGRPVDGLKARVLPACGLMARVLPVRGLLAWVLPVRGLMARVLPVRGLVAWVLPVRGLVARVLPVRGLMARGLVAGGLVIGGLSAAGGCAPSPTTPPIRVAAPRIAATRMPAPSAEADGLTPFDRWPQACDLLTPADLRAVLPQVTKVTQTPHEQRIRVTNLGDGPEDDSDAPESVCETRFWVAGTERKRHARPDLVRVEDIAVGDLDIVQDNYDTLAGSRRRIPGGLGAAECVLAGTVYYCRMPHVAFSVGTGPALYIDRFTAQPKHVAAQTYWVRDVLPEFVRSVASKLPDR